MNARTATTESPSDPWIAAAPAARFTTARFRGGWLLVLLCLVGCRGAAYRDVYQQKMASEIRVLEDQLYEADYHNQVLIDELSRAKARVAVPDSRRGRPAAEMRPPGRPDGDAAPPPSRPDRAAPTLPARPIPDARDRREPPEVAIPPGLDDLQFPDVDLGEPVPPAGRSAPAEPPPGQIRLPDSVRRLYRQEAVIPVAIRINQGLSGGHRFDDAQERTGMHLAIEATDEQGKLVALEDFVIQGELSVALLDPQRDPADARLGQWDFDEDQLRSMIRPGSAGPEPGGRIHVYVAWNEQRPLGGHVIAHVRLSADDTELRAQTELSTADTAVAQWNPRAGVKPR